MSDDQKRNDKKIPNWVLTGHKKPVTRREFLGHGIIPFAASMAAPNWLSLLMPNQAFAQANDCPVPERIFIPFITINCAGGAGLAGNFVPHTVGGQNLTSYNRLGMGSVANLNRATIFSNQAPFAGGATATTNAAVAGNAFTTGTEGNEQSRILRGIRRRTTATLLERTSFTAACVRSADDTGTANKFAVDGMLQKAGLGGSLLPIMGVRSTATGISQQTPAVYTPSAPLVVNSTAAIAAALNYAATISGSLNATQRTTLARTVLNLSSEQNRKIAMDATGTQVKKLLDCAGIKNIDNLQLANTGGGTVLSPLVQSIWGVNAGTAATNRENIFASIVANVLEGKSGSGLLEIGGCDYHLGGDRATADLKDLEIGDLIGRVLATAEAMNSPVFIYVVSDGAVNSQASDTPGATPWAGDAGECGAAYMISYKPTAAPIIEGVGTTPSWQIGGFTPGQVVDQTQVGGNDAEKIAAAAVVNWLYASGQSSKIAQAINSKLSDDEISRILRFRS